MLDCTWDAPQHAVGSARLQLAGHINTFAWQNPEQYLGDSCHGNFLQDIADGHRQGGILYEFGSCSEGVQRLIELICTICHLLNYHAHMKCGPS